MKKLIAAVVLAGMVGGGILIAGKNAGDAEKADAALKDMNASDLNPAPVDLSGAGAPNLTRDVVLAIINDLKSMEANNGILGIARKNGCSTAQVKIVMAAKNRRLSGLNEAQVIPK